MSILHNFIRYLNAISFMPFNIVFDDGDFTRRLIRYLPKLIDDLHTANKKGGKLSPDIGTLREKMMIGILKSQFGDRLKDDFGAQESEVDFELDGEPISFKTTKSKSFKLIWTSNYELAMNFYNNFIPSCSIVVLLIMNNIGGLYYFPLSLLVRIREQIGNLFLKEPRSGTNPRGVELSTDAFNKLSKSPFGRNIRINWNIIVEGESTAINFTEHYSNVWNSIRRL